jgi:hypothetical protein
LNSLREHRFIVTTSSFIPIDSCLHVFIDDAFHEGGGGEVIDLPPAELATLPQIAKVGAHPPRSILFWSFFL